MRFSDVRTNLTKDFSRFPAVRIAILGDSPTQILHQALKGRAYDCALNTFIYEAGISQIDAQILDSQSGLYGFRPDYIVIFESTQNMLARFSGLPRAEQTSFGVAHLQHVDTLCRAVKSALDAQIIYCNFPEMDDGVYGNYANKTRLSLLYQLRTVNLGLMDLAARTPHLFIADLSSLQNRSGRRNIVSNTTYATTGLVHGLDFWPEIAKAVLDIIQALRGRFHKAVVLDLDNTLWGGVVGDDGIENIQIGDLGIGRVFSELQTWLKQLRERGILLAVCSKNHEHVAREVFETHPDMVLRLDDIAVFVANWGNKVDNIRHIQRVLNIAFDSIVYLDDSAFERRMVKAAIPSLTVPELPEDPVDYLDMLRALNLFETGSMSENDESRTREYRLAATRASLQRSYDSEDAFLANLEMVASARPFDRFHAPRIAQLSQRSNQFNLRTVRYSEADVERRMNDPKYLPLYFTLEDRVGRYGLVSVVVLEKMDTFLFIENWLMSCRVLNRGLEAFGLNVVMRIASEGGYERVVGEYIPTEKNSLVKEHYQRMGFTAESGLWVMKTDGYVDKTTHIALDIALRSATHAR